MIYKKEDVYKDVRRLIEEGYSLRETSRMTGINYETVKTWTRDIRTIEAREYRRSVTKETWAAIERDHAAGMRQKDLAAKYGVSPSWISIHMKRKKSEGEKKMPGVISKTLDPRMLAAEAAEAKPAMPEKPAMHDSGLTMGRVTMNGKHGVRYVFDMDSQQVAFVMQDNKDENLIIGLDVLMNFAQECVQVASKADKIMKILEA